MKLPTREKLKLEALELFATKGFTNTTVGDIEQAAGLTPRAGGFYRHFPSKMSILESIVEETETDIFDDFESSLLLPLGDIKAELLTIGRMILRVGAKYASLRILLRAEGRNLPEFRKKMLSINSRLPKEYLIPWVSKQLKSSAFSNKNLEEMVQIIFGSVFYYMAGLDLSAEPYGLEQDSFLQSWAEVWAINLS